MSRDYILEALWNSASPQAAARDLYTAVSELRRVLEPGLGKPADSSFILSTEAGYQFNIASSHSLDKILLLGHIARAREHADRLELEMAAQDYAQAEGLYAGDYLPEDIYSDWTIGERERLRNTFLAMLLDAAEMRAQLGRYRQAIANCRRTLAMDNCLEEAYRALLFYLYASGDRAQALRVFVECQATLQRELDVEPMPATHVVAEQIRTQQVTGVDQNRKYPVPAAATLPYSFGRMPFTGRGHESVALREWVEAARQGQGSLVLVEGEGGIGKTYLVESVGSNPEFRIFRGQSHELTQGLPYHPVLDILRQAEQEKRIVPPQQAAHAQSESLEQLFNSFRQSLFALAPAILLLEDLQWADDGTLEFLAYLGPALANTSLLVIATLRPSERLASLLGRVGRAAWLHHLRLNPLSEEETVDLIRALAPPDTTLGGFGYRLYKATSGTPLFVANVLSRLFETGQLWRDAEGSWQGIRAPLAEPVLPTLTRWIHWWRSAQTVSREQPSER